MFIFLAFFVILATSASAIELPLLQHGPILHAAPALIAKPIIKTVEVEAPAHYDFSYSVHDDHTGDIKSQTESRKGDVVQGQYSLVDADGLLRIVDYTSDAHNGFNAVVRREPIGHKEVVKAIAPVAKVLAPVAAIGHLGLGPIAPLAHLGAPSLLGGPIHGAPALAHVSLQGPGYAYSH